MGKKRTTTTRTAGRVAKDTPPSSLVGPRRRLNCLPNISNLKYLHYAILNKRILNDTGCLFVNELLHVWIECFEAKSRKGRPLRLRQRQYLKAITAAFAAVDGNLLEGVLCKRPDVLDWGPDALRAVGADKMARILTRVAKFRAPQPHARTLKSRRRWLSLPAQEPALAKVDSMFYPSARAANDAYDHLLNLAARHPRQFFSGTTAYHDAQVARYIAAKAAWDARRTGVVTPRMD